MPKATSATKGKKPRHTPLHVEISKDSDMQKFGRVAAPASEKGKKRAGHSSAAAVVDDDVEEDKDGGVVGGRMSRKILEVDEDDDWEEDDEVDEKVAGTGQRIKRPDADEEEEDLDEGDVSDEEYAELVSPADECRNMRDREHVPTVIAFFPS